MEIWKVRTGTFADEDIAIEIVERFYPTDYGYDEPCVYEALFIKEREYVIDDIESFEYGKRIIAHKYSKVRNLKIQIWLVKSDWDSDWTYEAKMYKL